MIKCVCLSVILLASSAFSSDVRIGVGIGFRSPTPIYQTVVEQPSLVWVPPVYEQRYDSEGNAYLVVVCQGYYRQAPRAIYVEPRPSFSLGLFFGSPCGPRFGPPRGPGPFHGHGGPRHR